MADAGGSVSPLAYHQATKHTFTRFARSLGYLDWATQPSPFRRFDGAPLRPLPRTAVATEIPYPDLYRVRAPAACTDETVAEFLRCSLGLSAWKAYRETRWALRVNPSSGNLHPTEGYVVRDGVVAHYAPAEHALEERARLDVGPSPLTADGFLVALTSIHWREAWKYGERAFRYCQHDVGHALGALRLAASLLGWRLVMLPAWSSADLAAVLGLDRAGDFDDAEREEPELVALVSAGDVDPTAVAAAPFVDAARRAAWRGRANRLSPGHVEWPIIDGVAAATDYPGFSAPRPQVVRGPGADGPAAAPAARTILLQRRSATDFDPRGMLRRATFVAMLARLMPAGVPWDAVWWSPQVHLAVFVHRVEGLVPGVYAFMRGGMDVRAAWKAAMRPEFLWEPIEMLRDDAGLFLLAPLDVRQVAKRLSCDQDIAGDGFFSLGMIARTSGLSDYGPWFYRHLFWECGLIGQLLYLEAEAAGARGTGIGCFFDDAVHEVLGLTGADWQSLYHFSMGVPLDDARLTTEPGYPWEG